MPDTPAATTLQKPRFRILVALDRSEYTEIVLEHALDLAGRYERPDLHFLTVIEKGGDLEEAKRGLASAVLECLDDYDARDWRARLHIRRGQAHEEIACLAADIRANLIVVGRFGLHHPGNRTGSVASRVLDAATCPTLVVGLVDPAPEPRDQCPRCVQVRAETDGERWFCAAHSSPDRESITSFVSGPVWSGGGLLL